MSLKKNFYKNLNALINIIVKAKILICHQVPDRDQGPLKMEFEEVLFIDSFLLNEKFQDIQV